MATPTKDQANEDAIEAHEALTDAANAAWIVDADISLAQAIAQGKFHIAPLSNNKTCIKDIADHYNDLGYKVSTPACPTMYMQPAEYFGYLWDSYWSNRWICKCKQACRIRISWE